MADKSQQRLLKLRIELEKLEWPQVYTFKFIVPSDEENIAKVYALFEDVAKVSLKESAKGNYVSFTGKEMMISAESVISKYESAFKIEGLIAL